MPANKQSKQVAGAQGFMLRCNDPREPFLAWNSLIRVEEKRQRYLEAGAREVRLCGRTGRVLVFLNAASEPLMNASALCPDMPSWLK